MIATRRARRRLRSSYRAAQLQVRVYIHLRPFHAFNTTGFRHDKNRYFEAQVPSFMREHLFDEITFILYAIKAASCRWPLVCFI